MLSTRKEIREQLIELIGEGAWQYAYYNFDINSLIQKVNDIYQLAETIQDLIATDLGNNSDKSLGEFE